MKKKPLFIRGFGIYCSNSSSNNPKIIEVLFQRKNEKKYSSLGNFKLSLSFGTQILKIEELFFNNIERIKFIIKEAYGGKKAYINNIYLYEHLPNFNINVTYQDDDININDESKSNIIVKNLGNSNKLNLKDLNMNEITNSNNSNNNKEKIVSNNLPTRTTDILITESDLTEKPRKKKKKYFTLQSTKENFKNNSQNNEMFNKNIKTINLNIDKNQSEEKINKKENGEEEKQNISLVSDNEEIIEENISIQTYKKDLYNKNNIIFTNTDAQNNTLENNNIINTISNISDKNKVYNNENFKNKFNEYDLRISNIENDVNNLKEVINEILTNFNQIFNLNKNNFQNYKNEIKYNNILVECKKYIDNKISSTFENVNNNKINYYNNINENNNDNNLLNINTYNIKPFEKCKKIDFESLDNKLNEANNAIKNEHIHRQNCILTKLTKSKDKKSNKSMNIVHNQNIGNTKFKKYMNKLLENDNSFNKENIRNKTMNLTPILNHMNLNHYLANKNTKNTSAKNKVNNNNKNLFPIKFDCNLIKKNKITNLFEYYRINGLKQYMQRNNNIITNLNKKNNNTKKVNRYDLEEKLSEYMRKRFKNYIRKTNTNISNKSPNLHKYYLNSKNNNLSTEKNSVSPNSITNKGKNKLYLNLNKSYFKNNNKMIYSKMNKNSNNSSKNNSINNNRNKNKKNNNKFLFTNNFNNAIRKNLSNKNKNIKNRNNVNLTTYNSIISNNELKNTYKLNFHKNCHHNLHNNGNKTTYHSRGKSKNDIDIIHYSQFNNNNNYNLHNYNNIMNTNLYEFNNNINDNSNLVNNFNPYCFESQNYKNDNLGINNINLI